MNHPISIICVLVFLCLSSAVAFALSTGGSNGYPRALPLDGTDEANCTLHGNGTLERFKYETFYSWHTRDGNWTNVGQAPDLAELKTYFNLTHGRGSLVELDWVLWEPMSAVNSSLRGIHLRPDWRARWEAKAAELKDAVAEGIVIGFFLGDELVWNNITWDQLNETSHTVKSTFPTCFVQYNEGGAPLYASRNINGYHVDYPFVPEAIDYVSSDDYGTMYQFKNPPWFYRSFLYPKIKFSHQRVFIIPRCFSNPGKNHSDEYVLNQTIAYFRWIEKDDLIEGLDGYYFQGPNSLLTMPRTLRCYQYLARQLINHADASKKKKNENTLRLSTLQR